LRKVFTFDFFGVFSASDDDEEEELEEVEEAEELDEVSDLLRPFLSLFSPASDDGSNEGEDGASVALEEEVGVGGVEAPFSPAFSRTMAKKKRNETKMSTQRQSKSREEQQH